MSHARLAVFAFAAGALAAPGCGASSKAASLMRGELIAKADAICSRVHAEYHANGYRSIQDMARLAPRLASYEQTAVAELRKLTPPASMANDWRQIVAGAQTVASDTAKLGRYAKENNLKAATALYTASGQVERQALATARRDGFKACTQAS
jgi:hypothetical protein